MNILVVLFTTLSSDEHLRKRLMNNLNGVQFCIRHRSISRELYPETIPTRNACDSYQERALTKRRRVIGMLVCASVVHVPK